MGLTKTEIFNDRQNKLALMMKALAHPARIAIIQHLIKADACICGDLVDELGLAQATISQHLKELMKAGLIDGTVDGPRSCYCINWKAFEKFSNDIGSLFLNLKTRNEKCC